MLVAVVSVSYRQYLISVLLCFRVFFRLQCRKRSLCDLKAMQYHLRVLVKISSRKSEVKITVAAKELFEIDI